MTSTRHHSDKQVSIRSRSSSQECLAWRSEKPPADSIEMHRDDCGLSLLLVGTRFEKRDVQRTQKLCPLRHQHPGFGPRLFPSTPFAHSFMHDSERIAVDPTNHPDRSIVQPEPSKQNPEATWSRAPFEALAKPFGFTLDTPFNELDEQVIQVILYGTEERLPIKYKNEKNKGYYTLEKPFAGIIPDLKRRYFETNSMQIRMWMDTSKQPYLRGLPWFPVAVRSPFRVRGKQEHHRCDHDVDTQRAAVLRESRAYADPTRDITADPQGNTRKALLLGECRSRVPDARPPGRNAQRRGGTTHPPGNPDRFGH